MIQIKERTVLVIDDNLFIGDIIAGKLNTIGLHAVVSSNGEDALKKNEEVHPSLILLDMPLSGTIDGFEVLKRIRKIKNERELPIIVFSSFEAPEDMKRSIELGANEYLIKAYTTITELTLKIKDFLEGGERKILRDPKSKKEGRISEKEGEVKVSTTPDADDVGFVAKRIKAQIEKALVSPEDVPIISLVDNLMQYGFLMRASDVHIEPFADFITVRLRIDGVMNNSFSFPKAIHSALITRVKVLSGLRIDEHQIAQDGRFKIKMPDLGFVDVRVSIAPTYYGENCVMRILAEKNQAFTLENLGFSDIQLKKINSAIRKPYGMILTVGPTGSGKTTTLYSILKKLNTKEVSIITIEDPIEYSLQGVDQIQVNAAVGLTFAHGLRFILRQDPDIIMVGEIRDDETANIAINAAMTGHTVLSTLHANDASTTLPRLIDMHIEPFLITSTINIIIGQRLVRTICNDCKVPVTLTDAERNRLKEFISDNLLKEHKKFYTGSKCSSCGETGFKGRIGIHEVLEINDEVRNLIMKKANADEIRKAAIQSGMQTMLEDGFEKALQGVTTIEEVLRVFRE